MKRIVKHISIGCILLLLVVLLAACRGPAASQTDLPTEPEVTSTVAPNEAQLPSLNMLRLTDLVDRCGDSLSWNDFMRFHSVDMGSELCLLRYDMDEEYYLLIGGESRKKSPAFIWLVSEKDADQYIEVRTESIEAFLKHCEEPADLDTSIEIIFADYINDTPIFEFPELPNGVQASLELVEVVDQAENDDLIAFVVCGYPRVEGWRTVFGEEYDILYEAAETARKHLIEVSDQIVTDLAETRGISREEAKVRKFAVPEFIEARSVYYKALRERNSCKLIWDLEQSNGVLEKLAVLGFTILYDGSNPDFQDYLIKFRCHPVGVAVGTKEQILALDSEALGFDLILKLAMKDSDNIGINDSYSEKIRLTGDNKLTDELLAAYQENGGAALPVKVKIGYFGRRSHTDYHKDYNYDVITRFLRDEELLQWDEFENYYHCNFYANLTYERAMEITQNKEIAYIELLTEYPDGSAE